MLTGWGQFLLPYSYLHVLTERISATAAIYHSRAFKANIQNDWLTTIKMQHGDN